MLAAYAAILGLKTALVVLTLIVKPETRLVGAGDSERTRLLYNPQLWAYHYAVITTYYSGTGD